MVLQILDAFQAKTMNMVAGVKFFDFVEHWVFDAPLQPKPAVEPMFSSHRAGKANPALKGDARLLWDYRNRPEAFHQFQVGVEKLSYKRVFIFEMVGKRVMAA